MGLFDDVRCLYPLPDGFEPGSRTFQTKSFPDPYLSMYTITADGRLLDAQGEDTGYHGDLTFYRLNWGDSYRDMRVTEDGEPPHWREYVARFTEGQLTRITGGIRPLDGRAATREAIEEARRLDAERGVDERDRPLILKPGEKRK